MATIRVGDCGSAQSPLQLCQLQLSLHLCPVRSRPILSVAQGASPPALAVITDMLLAAGGMWFFMATIFYYYSHNNMMTGEQISGDADRPSAGALT